jgi:hypothetical protein
LAIARPIRLSEAQARDAAAFLRALSGPIVAPRLGADRLAGR